MENLVRFDLLATAPWYWVMFLIITTTTLVGSAGFLLIRRIVNQQTLLKNQEITSYALNTIALLYCVIVGFVVIRVQERHSTVRDITIKEANLLLNLYYSSCDVFSNQTSANIRQRIYEYAYDVVEKEWPKMTEGKDIALAFPRSVHQLWMTYDRINPENNGQLARYQESLSRLNELSEARFGRLSNVSRSEGIFMWSVLIYGGILVIFTSYLFASSSLLEHLMQIIFITSFIALVLLLIYTLDSPFTGPTSIKPTPYQHVMELIDIKHRPTAISCPVE